MRTLGLGSCLVEGSLLFAAFLAGCGNSSGGATPGTEERADAATSADANGSGNGVPIASISDPFGFATQYVDPATGEMKNVTGGAGATATSTYVVHNRKELQGALANVNSPT